MRRWSGIYIYFGSEFFDLAVGRFAKDFIRGKFGLFEHFLRSIKDRMTGASLYGFRSGACQDQYFRLFRTQEYDTEIETFPYQCLPPRSP